MWGHNGAIIGYYSTMLYNPIDSTAFVALINQNGLDAEEILAQIVTEYYRTSSVHDDAVADGIDIAPSHPNPFATSTTIGYRLERPADVSVKIYTVTGALVRIIEHGRRDAGSHASIWDGRDAAGSPVTDGAYICRIESRSGATSTLVVKMGMRGLEPFYSSPS